MYILSSFCLFNQIKENKKCVIVLFFIYYVLDQFVGDNNYVCIKIWRDMFHGTDLLINMQGQSIH